MADRYTKDQLHAAVAAHENGMSLRKASELYGVPRSTISDKKTGKRPLDATKGPECILGEETEKRLADWVLQMCRIGYGQTKPDLMLKVTKSF